MPHERSLIRPLVTIDSSYGRYLFSAWQTSLDDGGLVTPCLPQSKVPILEVVPLLCTV
jgi:hypothetical protein